MELWTKVPNRARITVLLQFNLIALLSINVSTSIAILFAHQLIRCRTVDLFHCKLQKMKLKLTLCSAGEQANVSG